MIKNPSEPTVLTLVKVPDHSAPLSECTSGRQATPRAPPLLTWLFSASRRKAAAHTDGQAADCYKLVLRKPKLQALHRHSLEAFNSLMRAAGRAEAAFTGRCSRLFHLSSTQVHTILPDRKAQHRCLNELIL